MDAMAAKLLAGDVTDRVHAYPVESVTVPCVVIGYPSEIDFDMTFGRGSDRAVFPVWFIAGKTMTKATRDAVSARLTGIAAVKNVLDGPLTVGSATASLRVTNATVEAVTVGGVGYLAVRFDTEVIS